MTVDNLYSQERAEQHNQVTVIKLSVQERADGVPTLQTIRDAVRAIHRDGLVVLEDAIDPAHLDKLNERMVKEAIQLLSLENAHFNGVGTGNISQVPPVYPGYVFKDIYANPFGAAIISAILGPRPQLRFLRANTNTKSTKRQEVHADDKWDYYDFPYALVANVMLVDVTPKNGSTEIWLGSHKTSSRSLHKSHDVGYIDPKHLEQRRQTMPPIYPCIRKGSFIIRDLRLWHAGMPNSVEEPRVMLGMVHMPAWLDNNLRLSLPVSAKEQMEEIQSDIDIVADYIEDSKYNHMTLEFKNDFSPRGGR